MCVRVVNLTLVSYPHVHGDEYMVGGMYTSYITVKYYYYTVTKQTAMYIHVQCRIG